MQNFVTIETAIALCEKGFQQPPQKKFGQVWYMLHVGQSILIGSALGNEIEKYPHVFAPRATDIMPHLGKNYYLTFDNGIWQLCWWLPDREVEVLGTHPNPAELLADEHLRRVRGGLLQNIQNY